MDVAKAAKNPISGTILGASGLTASAACLYYSYTISEQVKLEKEDTKKKLAASDKKIETVSDNVSITIDEMAKLRTIINNQATGMNHLQSLINDLVTKVKGLTASNIQLTKQVRNLEKRSGVSVAQTEKTSRKAPAVQVQVQEEDVSSSEEDEDEELEEQTPPIIPSKKKTGR